MYQVKFADIGEGLHEGRVVTIYKQVGESVSEGDSLFSVETDKITSDIPSPVDGTIARLLINVDDVIHVGNVVVIIDDGSGGTVDDILVESHSSATEEEEVASVVGSITASNDLLDLSMFNTPQNQKSKPTAEGEKLSGNPGREYTGPITESYDVIIIGGGPGGYLAAELASKAQLRTLIVEKEFYGGVCLNVGCIPTKTLLKSVELLREVRHGALFGLSNSRMRLNWERAQQHKSDVVHRLTDGIRGLLKSAGATCIDGKAHFVGAHEIEVAGKVYRGKHIILATGSLDKRLNLEGFAKGYEQGHIITSREALMNTAALPKNITIIGGGVISCEMAQIYAGFGHRVRIIQIGDRILPTLDPEMTKLLAEQMQADGIEILNNTTPVSYDANKRMLTYRSADGKDISEQVEIILTAIGRYPVALNVDKMGVEVDARGAVVVDEHCATNVDRFYAIGDCNGLNMLAHAAYRHAVVVVNDILQQEDNTTAGDVIPSVVYTTPELATIGLDEKGAREAGHDYIVGKYNYSHLGKAIAADKTVGFCKLIIARDNGAILGAQIVGSGAGDMISEISVAITSEATVYELTRAIHPHPTLSEIIWEAARSAIARLKK